MDGLRHRRFDHTASRTYVVAVPYVLLVLYVPFSIFYPLASVFRLSRWPCCKHRFLFAFSLNRIIIQ